MNAREVQHDLELAAWQMAKATTLERKAAKLRLEGTKTIASAAAQLKQAIETATNRQPSLKSA
jgi:hypothetical protein